MKRTAGVWIIFLASVGIVAGTMAWATFRLLDLERSEQRLLVQAENERLALWRIDSALLPLVSRESGRSIEGWQNSELPTSRRSFGTSLPADSGDSSFVPFRFEANSRGELLWPRDVPEGSDSAVAEFQQRVSPSALASAVQQALPSRVLLTPAEQEFALNNTLVINSEVEATAPEDSLLLQQSRNGREFQRRLNNSLTNAAVNNFVSQVAINSGQYPNLNAESGRRSGDDAGKAADRVTPMTAMWCADQLILARRVLKGGTEKLQGCVLDWSAMREWLLEEVRDLLPEARLEPARAELNEETHTLLATLPVLVIPGRATIDSAVTNTPLRTSLITAWFWLTLSAAAIGFLLFGMMRLSERRATFVSAVTHELRTPLTTFQLYADLLNSADLPDDKRRHYAETLRHEADRLRHLVDNVLAWSRLDRSSEQEVIAPYDWSEFWPRCEATLRRRAEQADMQLVSTDTSGGLCLKANPAAVDQILFNLVDNACKYAASADDRRIHVDTEQSAQELVIRVSDHGPGLTDAVRSRLFQPFSKSATEAARSAPGVGLGLSLCRQLARGLNGDVTCERSSDSGTTFLLRLPLATG